MKYNFCHQQQHFRRENNINFEPRIYKLPSAKNILGDFCYVQFFYRTSAVTLLDEAIYHQVIPSFWKYQLLYYSSASQILANFGVMLPAYCHHGLTLLHSSTLTLTQPGDIVFSSALTVHYHKNSISQGDFCWIIMHDLT